MVNGEILRLVNQNILMSKNFHTSLIGAMLFSAAGALSPAQQQAHFSQVLSNMGAVVQACPKDWTSEYTCAKTATSSTLAIKEWDLYSSWSSKVSATAEHDTPWKLSDTGSITTARFVTKDGDKYGVSIGPLDGQTFIAMKWFASAGALASAPQSSGVTGSASAVVKASAAPTRTGPLQVSMGDITSYGLTGPIKSMVRKTMTVDASGRETLKTTETITFNQAGNVVTSERINAGESPFSAKNTFDENGRVTFREVRDEKGKITTYRSEYDAQGNLAVRTKFEGDKKVSVTRYTPMPNGYVSEEFGPSGDATTRTFTLLDDKNRTLDEEMLGTLRVRTQNFYDGDLLTKSMITIGTFGTGTYEYEQGRRVKYTNIGEGILKGKNTFTTFQYVGLDKYGNFTKRLEGKEEISFGEKKFAPSEIVYQTVEYF